MTLEANRLMVFPEKGRARGQIPEKKKRRNSETNARTRYRRTVGNYEGIRNISIYEEGKVKT